MTENKENHLFNTYPNLFPNGRQADRTTSLMRFGFPGDGWFELLDNLCRKITETNIAVTVVQVKEKFGTLRFYVDFPEGTDKGSVNKVYGLIKKAEEKSEVTCEWCGAPATLRQGSWWRVLCDTCETEREKKRADQKW